MKAVLFDLDDTLYPEIEFVKSGFTAVARHLSSRYQLDRESLLEQMLAVLQKDGRGRVFDTVLQDLGMYREERVRLLVYLYRSHRPTIQLYEDALPMLKLLRETGFRLGIITDGLASVQRSKVRALGIEDCFDAVVYTDEVGSDYWKPSVAPYQVALSLVEVQPSEAVYVGNDLTKDFLGANTLGMLTIQVKRSVAQNLVRMKRGDRAAPNYLINGLDRLLPVIEEETVAQTHV